MTRLPDGPFLTSDLPALGLARWQLDELVASGAVRRVVRSAYVDSAIPDSIPLRAQCVAMVAPGHVVVSDRSAAWLHGVDTYDLAARELPPDLEVVSIGPHDRTRRAGVLGGKRALAPEDLCEVCGVLTTTALRTACDLACLRGRSAALAVLDAFMRTHGLTRADFERVLPRFRGRRGVKQLRELVRHAIPDAESPGESWTRLAIIDAGLPCPVAQLWVTVPGYGRVRLDLAYPALRIAIEYDGEEFHGSEADRARDRARRDALRRAGWVVVVVTKGDFTGESLVGWISELRRALADRRPVAVRRYSRGPEVDAPPRRRTGATSRMS